MGKPRIAVMGATGHVGRALVDELVLAGHRPRVMSRNQGRLAAWAGRIDAVIGDVQDAEVTRRLFDGADRLFMMSFIELPEEIDRRIIEQAGRAGVCHVVKLSTVGVDSSVPIGQRHGRREQWIEQSGMAWTFLRPGFFMSNALRWAPMLRNDGRVFAPAADGVAAPISPRDIAAVAMAALFANGYAGQVLVLTGREMLSARDQISVLARVLRRSIECVDVPVDTAIENARKAGQPEWVVESLERMWRGLASNDNVFKTETVAEVTGHSPRTFLSWCEENSTQFSAE